MIKQSVLRAFRVVISVLVILSISLLFVDIKEVIPVSAYDYVLFPQFIPSLLSFIKAGSWISIGFIIVILLSILWGRVYCSFLCPLGIFQDVISYFSRKLGFIKRYKFSKAFSKARYILLIVTTVFLIFNIISLVTVLDPYSNYGRILNGLFRPVILLINNFLAFVFEKLNVYYFAPLQIKTNVVSIIYASLILLVLLYMAGKRGRLFCNMICPVGTFLGLISKYSIFKISIDKISCSSCGKCSTSCKSECISVKNKEVDMSRCVGCMNCISSCETGDIKYMPAYKTVVQNNTEIKRSQIKDTISFILILFGFSKLVKANEIDTVKINKKFKPTKIAYKKTFNVSPPGSESHQHFNGACTGCHLCVSVCPTKVLQPSLLQYGLKGVLQPFMDYNVNYCNFECTKCGDVCPTGAILPVGNEEKKTIQLGKVVFVKENCVVYTENTACGSCAEHCPTKAVHMIPYKNGITIPETDDKICIGCGACEYACPMRPFKAIYVDGHDYHQTADKPKVEKLLDEVEEDFPF